MKAFSWQRLLAIFIKEFQQMLRDRLTFAMAIGVPIMQLVLFGYAINTDPKGLPTAVVSADSGPLARSLSAALQNTGYFKVIHTGTSEREAEALIEDGDAQFMVVIPNDFTQRVLRSESPRCWSRSMPPIRRRRAMRSPRSASSRTRRSRTISPAR